VFRIAEAGGIANFSYLAGAILKQQLRMFEAYTSQILMRREASDLLEYATEMKPAHVCTRGDIM
jgi:hypothetical protein